MATTTTQENNKLVLFTKDINREFVRENLFSPYMGEDMTAIIRVRADFKGGGEQMNIPLVAKLKGAGVGSGQLRGNEENIDNYGMRLWMDWARNGIEIKKNQQHKSSIDLIALAKPLLSDWGKERQRDELIEAFMALPSESTPAGFGSDPGDCVNGIRFQAATAAQRNTWNANNSDRVLHGSAKSNYNATFATALANVDTTNDKLTAANISLLKRIARTASPKIRPYKTTDGREYFVAFTGSFAFRDLKTSLDAINRDARPRDVESNPIFQDGDLMYDGVIIREIPEIDDYIDNVWTTLATGGASSARVSPVFLCGQQAATLGWGQMAKFVTEDDDYKFKDLIGVDMAYGVGKIFKKHGPSDKLVQWGVATGFFAAAAD